LQLAFYCINIFNFKEFNLIEMFTQNAEKDFALAVAEFSR